MFVYDGSILGALEPYSSCRTSRFIFLSLSTAEKKAPRTQIDRLNLEGYANLDHWVAELDQKIEGILLQRLKHVAQAWCTEFDRTADDGEMRRDPIQIKRRGDKQRGEKVGRFLLYPQSVQQLERLTLHEHSSWKGA